MADEDTKIDRVLSHLDSLHEKIDSMKVRQDAMEDEHKRDRADAAEWKARADAAEKEREDKARKDAEEKEKADKMRADAEEKDRKEKEEKERADKERRDADEKEKADAAARAAVNTDLAQKLAGIEARLPAILSDADKGAFADAQMRADGAYQAWNLGQAPHALNGETLADYRVRLLGKLKQHSKVYKDSNLGLLVADSAAFKVIEDAIINDAVEASSSAVTLGAPLREHATRNASGHMVTKFVGDPAVTWAPFMGGATKFGKIVRHAIGR